ncbi:hypothetical protein L9F63_025905, partial [Diploptera punctata]
MSMRHCTSFDKIWSLQYSSIYHFALASISSGSYTSELSPKIRLHEARGERFCSSCDGVLIKPMSGRDPASDQLVNFKKNLRKQKLKQDMETPVDNRGASLTVGPRGPMLLQDITFLDELAHFDRERIPERVVHAKGAGAFGYFEVTHDISKYCKANVFSKIGKKTPIAVRFSTVGGGK